MQAGDRTTRAAREHGRDGVSYYIILHGVTDRPKHKPVHRCDKFCTSLYSLQSLTMPRNATKNPSKGKSAGLSRLEKVVMPAHNYRGPVTRRQGLRSAKVEVELGKIFFLRRWIAAY